MSQSHARRTLHSFARHAGQTLGLAALVVFASATDCPGDPVGPTRFDIRATTEQPINVTPGQIATVELAVTRLNGFTGAITINEIGGVIDVETQTIPADASTASITFSVSSSAPMGRTTIDLRASFQDSEVAEFVDINIGPRPFELTASPTSVSINPGGSANVTATVVRTAGNTSAVAFTGASSTIGVTVTPVTLAGTATQTPVQINVGPAVAPGDYSISVTGSQGVIGAQGTYATGAVISVHVGAGSGYTLSAPSSNINVTAGASQPVQLTIARTSFTGPVTVSATTTEAGISVTASPVGATTGSLVTLSVAVAQQSVAVGTHTVNVKGTSSVPDVTTSFTVTVGLAAGGTPAGIVIVPPTATKSVGGTQQFTAYLVDAQGNRVLPEAGFVVAIATANSNVANVQSIQNYETTQRWRTATIVGTGVGTTQVTALYVNSGTGVTAFSANATMNITP